MRCKEKTRICRNCGSQSCRIHDPGKVRRIHHTPLFRKPCLLIVKQRRFICNVCGSTFMELLDWIYPHINITRALFHQIYEDLKHYTSKKEIARVNGITPHFVSAVEKKIRFGVAPYLPVLIKIVLQTE
ncbi:MAG: transposase [Lachnospiraceae bacterium]|nr:transposase [Lachnospiraceae bacterium]